MKNRKCSQCGGKTVKKLGKVICLHCFNKNTKKSRIYTYPSWTVKRSISRGRVLNFDQLAGVEIEVERKPFSNLSKFLDVSPGCGISSDASLNNGIEVKTPPRQRWVFENTIRRTCLAIQKTGYKPERSCGLHIHLDFNKEIKRENIKAIDKFYKSYYAAEDVLYFSLPFQRRTNPYSSFITQKHDFNLISHQDSVYSLNFYGSISSEPITKYGTIESRSHEGSIDPDEIIKWTGVLLSIADYARKRFNETELLKILNMHSNSQERRQATYSLLRLTPTLKKYLEQRTKDNYSNLDKDGFRHKENPNHSNLYIPF